MLTMTFAIGTGVWLIAGIITIIWMYFKGCELLNVIGFVGVVWGCLVITTCLVGEVEKDYRKYHSGVNYDYASRMA